MMMMMKIMDNNVICNIVYIFTICQELFLVVCMHYFI